MKKYHVISAALALFVIASASAAQDVQRELAQAGNCQAIGNRVAAQNGATLVSAQQVSVSGQTVCRVTILIPPQAGQRPRRETIDVPQ